ncbi:MAG: hypothetical protein LBD48_11875 [Treponema sp.]|nr:hypothetical protein [Treponema sp.]
MTREEKLNKVSCDFSSLSEEKQDYILGILQALVFANSQARAGHEKKNAENKPQTKM